MMGRAWVMWGIYRTLAMLAMMPVLILPLRVPPCPEWPPEIMPYERYIREAAEFHGLRPSLLAALVWRESGGDPNIVSRQGAIGLTQVVPGIHPCATFHPMANIYCGASILGLYTRNANGDERAGLAAYYAGETGRERDRDGWDFADLVLSMEEWFRADDEIAWCEETGWTQWMVPHGRATPGGEPADPAEQPTSAAPRRGVRRPLSSLLVLVK